MKLPPELNEYWKSYAASNPRGLSGAEIEQLNQKFRAQKQGADRQAMLERRDLELYQQNWEEISGSNTQAPEYIQNDSGFYGANGFTKGAPRFTYNAAVRDFLQGRAAELKKHQRIMSENQQKEQRQQKSNAEFANYYGQNNYNRSNGSTNSPSMQNPFQF